MYANKNKQFLKLLFVFVFSVLIVFSINAQNDELLYINTIKVEGNTKTKVETILRELTFSEGDTILKDDFYSIVDESKKNLLNTPLFNYVTVDISKDSTINIDITVSVEERWYLWPQGGIYYADRNFSNWFKNKDFTRTDFGLGLVKYNLRGRNEKLSFFTIFGYDEEFLLYYEDIFIDKHKKHSMGIFLKQLRRKETGCIIENDKLRQIKLNDDYALKSYKFSLKYTYRKEYLNTHSFYLGYENRRLSDSLLMCNPNYTVSSQSAINYLFLKYIFINDNRNSRIFPTDGYYLKLTALKSGLYLFPESEINSFYLKNEISKYTKLSERVSLGNHLTLKYKTDNKQPFFLNTALGYLSNIRGYEYYVINGTSLALTKNTLNIKVIPKKVIHLKQLPFKRFNKIHFTVYASIFADAAYVKNSDLIYNQNNTLANTFLYSSGLSLNILTYYDALFRLDYSVNHLMQAGFYLHFETPF